MEVDPPEILALHGNVGSAKDWSSLELSTLTAIDLWDWSELSFFEFAHELSTSLSRGMERPILAGYSLGGRLALYAMAIHPERWGGAIIASSHPGLRCVEDRLARVSSDAIWAKRARELPWVEFLSAWNQQPVLAGENVGEGQLDLEAARDSIAMAFETWSLGRQEDLRSSLRRFHPPVLWITGEQDLKFSSLAEEMEDVFPSLTRRVIPGVGHRVLGSELGQEIRRWLSATQSGSES